MSNHDDEYKIIIIISVISGCMCIVIAMIGVLCCMWDSSILLCKGNKIKNIYTMQNVLLHEEDTV